MNTEYTKRLEKTVGRGLCYGCGAPLDRQGVRCTACAAKANEYKKLTHEWHVQNHICTACGRERVYGTDMTCFECRAKAAIIRQKYMISTAQKEANAARARTIYKQRCEDGICVVCGKRKAATDRRKCHICLIKEAERARIRRNK